MTLKERTTHQRKVKDVFKGTASRYDLLNRLLSLGIDKSWRRQTAALINPAGKKILDLCAGTGDLSFEIIRQGDRKTEVIAADFSQEMIDYGEQKAGLQDKRGQVKFVLEDVASLNMADESVDAVTIAFGIRNIEDKERQKALAEFLRVTKKNGRLVCLEFTHPSNRLVRWTYFLYLSTAVPLLARLFSEKPGAYYYLARSIKNFPDQKDFARLIEKAGWKKVNYLNLTFGIVAIHTAEKL